MTDAIPSVMRVYFENDRLSKQDSRDAIINMLTTVIILAISFGIYVCK